MPIFFTQHSRYPVEFSLLLLFILFLPSLEAPKNILWLLYALTWLINRVYHRDYKGRWDSWDSLIVLWIASGYIVALFSGIKANELRGADDILRYGIILWTIKRANYSEQEFKMLLIALLLSVVISIIAGVGVLALRYRILEIRLAIYGYTGPLPRHYMLELHSVGHANHSVMYLVMMLGTALAACVTWWGKISYRLRMVFIVVLLLLLGAIALTASRAAALVMPFLVILIGIAWYKRSPGVTKALMAICAVMIAIALVGNFQVVRKMETFVKEGNILSGRDKIWNSAFAAWRAFPIFGIGMDNYSKISKDKLREWQKEKSFVESEHGIAPHAHSLYVNTLTERGLFGLAVLLSILIYWVYSLIKQRPKAESQDLEWILWGGSLSAWFTTVFIGLVNTTLHHEVALLPAILLGMWLSYKKQGVGDRG